jgi:predicted methyltransferase
MLRRFVVIVLVLAACGTAACQEKDTYQAEASHLATLLNWKPGSVVAEIGAGDGRMTLAAALRVAPGGRVYTTELDPKKLTHLEELASKEQNLTAIKAGDTTTNLPPECCDSIFMRRVYHHFTHPTDIDASLFRSVKPGGLLAVIDQVPSPGSSVPEGVPKNRGGHGMPEKLLVDELTAAGFQVVTQIDPWADWPQHNYCVVFRKPGP